MATSTTILNCTPHSIKYRPAGRGTVEFPPTGIVPRVSTVESEAASISCTLDCGGGFILDCIQQSLGEVEGLPSASPHIYYIVSRMVFDAAPDRVDLIVPDTGKGAVRDEQGRIVAVTRFIRR